MKKILLASAALVALSVPSLAADLPVKAAPAPVYAPIYSWSGFYLGAHIGYAFTGSDDVLGFANDDSSGFMIGGQLGYDWQLSPNWVIGLEGQLSWVNTDKNLVAPALGIAVTGGNDWLASITGRIGYSWGPGLLYVKGGFAFADTNYDLVAAGVPGTFTSSGNSSSGWTLGAGLEYMFAPNWSAKLEYQYYDFGNDTLVANVAPFITGVSVDNNIHSVKLGVNYRFNWGR